jgi:DNA-binding transcriptional MerR regulator
MPSLFPEQRPRPATKSASAFRTISEVSAELEVPQHVLRFWETKFPQIRPLKRGGGRRYYRPEDVDLLRRIQHLLYAQGYTIKGVQRLLREGRGAEGEVGVSTRPEDDVAELESDQADLLPEALAAETSDLPEATTEVPGTGTRTAELRSVLDELVSLRDLLRGV